MMVVMMVSLSLPIQTAGNPMQINIDIVVAFLEQSSKGIWIAQSMSRSSVEGSTLRLSRTLCMAHSMYGPHVFFLCITCSSSLFVPAVSAPFVGVDPSASEPCDCKHSAQQTDSWFLQLQPSQHPTSIPSTVLHSVLMTPEGGTANSASILEP
jgi:hypothetical protein